MLFWWTQESFYPDEFAVIDGGRIRRTFRYEHPEDGWIEMCAIDPDDALLASLLATEQEGLADNFNVMYGVVCVAGPNGERFRDKIAAELPGRHHWTMVWPDGANIIAGFEREAVELALQRVITRPEK